MYASIPFGSLAHKLDSATNALEEGRQHNIESIGLLAEHGLLIKHLEPSTYVISYEFTLSLVWLCFDDNKLVFRALTPTPRRTCEGDA